MNELNQKLVNATEKLATKTMTIPAAYKTVNFMSKINKSTSIE